MKPTATAAENPPPSVSKRWCRGFQDPVPVFTTKGKKDHVVKEPLICSLLRRSNASFRAPACHNAPDCSGRSGAMVPPESSVRGAGAGSRMTLKWCWNPPFLLLPGTVMTWICFHALFPSVSARPPQDRAPRPLPLFTCTVLML